MKTKFAFASYISSMVFRGCLVLALVTFGIVALINIMYLLWGFIMGVLFAIHAAIVGGITGLVSGILVALMSYFFFDASQEDNQIFQYCAKIVVALSTVLAGFLAWYFTLPMTNLVHESLILNWALSLSVPTALLMIVVHHHVFPFMFATTRKHKL